MKLSGLVVTITGAGGGIGRELAVLLRRDFQCHLALCDNDESRLKETLACVAFVTTPHSNTNAVHLRTTTHVVDVSERHQVLDFAEDVRNTHGRCELVFNNAGVAHNFSFADADFAQIDRVLQVNLGGVINIAKAFLPLLQQSHDGACLVNMSSMAGFMPFMGHSAYVMAKYAVRGLSETLQLEAQQLYPHVRIICVLPGLIKTKLFANNTEHMQEAFEVNASKMDDLMHQFASTTPKQAAEQILHAIQPNNTKTRVVIGTDAKLLDFALRCMPSYWLQTPMRWKLLVAWSVLVARFIGKRFLALVTLVLITSNFNRLQHAWNQVSSRVLEFL